MTRVFVAGVLALTAAVPAVSGQSPSAAPPPSAAAAQAAAQTKTLNLTAYGELLRADLRFEKAAILTQMMGFTDAEDKAFWPIYREYDAEMTRLGEERVALVAEYARVYDSLTDDAADRIARRAVDLEARRQAVKAKYYDRVQSALKGRTALRFLQVEHQLQLLLDLQISAALPIAGR